LKISVHEAERLSLEQIRGFIAASEELRFASEDRAQRYAWVERVLVEQHAKATLFDQLRTSA
jgi:hypothetical protein